MVTKARSGKAYPDLDAIAVAAARSRRGKVESTHTYRDDDGNPVFGVVRVRHRDGTKDVPQVRPERSGWVFGGIGKNRPLYNLPELLAASVDVPVSVLEGEPKADRMMALGFLATTTSQGAGSAKLSNFSPLAGRIVLLFPDNDDAGSAHMKDVAARAHAAGAASVALVTLPGLPPKGDVIDFWAARREAGRTADQIVDEIRDAIAKAIDVLAGDRSGFPVSPPGQQDPTAPPTWQPFPVDHLPPVCRAMVEHGASALGIDPAFLAVLLLGVLAGCIGATRRAKLTADWSEPAALWLVLIAVSGASKSPALRMPLRPLSEHDYRLHEQTVAAQRAHAAAIDQWRAAKCQGERPEPPPMLAALVDDITCEALAVRLLDNPRGLLLAVDEIAGWVKSWNKYRRGGDDAQRWLSIHNADALKVDRRSMPGGNAPRIYVRQAAVSVVGTIQPETARHYLGAREQRQSGGAARLLIAAPPVVPAQSLRRNPA